MSVWLMQHGLAEEEAVDPRKPLSAEGWRQVEAVADLLFALPARPARILHSGKLRAEQTANIVSAALSVPAEHHLGLDPADIVEPWVPRVSAEELLIVGHLPFLGKLAASLLGADVVRFTPGGVVHFDRHGGGWQVVWALTPELAEARLPPASQRV